MDSQWPGKAGGFSAEQALDGLAALAAEAAGANPGALFDTLARHLRCLLSARGTVLASYLPQSSEVELRVVLDETGQSIDLSGLASRRRQVSQAWLASQTSPNVRCCAHDRDCLVSLFGEELRRLLPPGCVCHRLGCAPSGRPLLVGTVALSAEIRPGEKRALDAFLGLAGTILLRAEAAEDLRRNETQIERLVEERSRHLHRILKAATHAVIMATDSEGVLTLFNVGAERCLEYAAAEVVGKTSWQRFFLEREIAEHAAALEREFGQPIPPDQALTERARRGGDDQRIWTLVGKDGRTAVVDLTVTAIRDHDGRLDGYLAVAHDMRDHLEVREQLRSARRAAETANRVRSEFLARMSHEIRTPLNGIVGMAEVLENTGLDSEQREYVRALSSSAQSLLDIVVKILDFSVLEQGAAEHETEEFGIGDLLQKLDRTYGKRARDKGLGYAANVSAGVPGRLVGDRLRLEQLLGSLLDNAVRFTTQGAVALTVRCISDEDGRGVFSFAVRDSGPGIEPERVPELFQAFTQLDGSSTRTYGGTGLGLAIAQRLAELLGGRIAVDSEVGTGTTFTLAMPLGIPARPAARPSLLAVGCLAEDPAFGALADANWKVECVPTGAEALKSVREAPVDVVAFQFGAKDVDIAGTVRQIRRLERAWGILHHGQDVQPSHMLLVGLLKGDADPAIWQAHGLGLERVLRLPLEPDALVREMKGERSSSASPYAGRNPT